MRLRLAALTVTLFAVGCMTRASTREGSLVAISRTRPTPVQRETAMLASITNAELRVRMNQDLGPGVSPVKDTFTARLVSPIVGSNGLVLVPIGSLVWGHVVHVDDASRRVEIAFDRLETRTAIYRLSAVVIDAQPYAVTVRPEGTPTTATVVLQGSAPSAIGGGPPVPASEPADENAPRGDVIVPFDAELRLKLTEALVATSAG
jgi:hypothetical protein